ncbi:rod shape-determining protein MreC [Alteriqipengyuania lutimaris]|uniref:Cell shape-determining protein MreC n=1 Tax=Alteriqipengyuania lutimaris TaxID=1538146 RepID=A0A395LLQ1_9SPHN|nr:rod shape-determining protein MreC [Alteriqipengyuania lutimaris]MBB3032955.1 rod shape-determining protein MreC [Alteriqipengyuania lutimaris]RDS77966.1 rod shape-determining protein MreC [Alteriqipengyuania lutimaris]
MPLSGSKQRISGHSKKAQFGAFTGYVLVVLAMLLGVILLAVSLIQPASFTGLRGLFGDATQPAAQVSASARSGGRGFIESVQGYLEAGQQNADLKKEVEIARIRLAEARATEEENRRLKALLGLGKTDVEPVAVARLIGSSATSTRRFAYLGAGRSDGVQPGMPVRSERGIVGRVLEASRNSARVLLITDSESVLPVRRAGDNTVAFAEGRGDGLINIRLINLGINPLERGDVFVTSGAGGLYRPGIAVAIVTRLTDDGAVARIISNPAATDFVAVEPLWQPEALRGAETPIEEAIGSNETVQQEDGDETPPTTEQGGVVTP